jgi:hypothetical protein
MNYLVHPPRHLTVRALRFESLQNHWLLAASGILPYEPLAMQDHRLQMAKEDAIVAMQFDRAAAVRDAQYRERDRLVMAVARMLGEADPTERESV